MIELNLLTKLEDLQKEQDTLLIENKISTNPDFFHPLFYHLMVERFVQEGNLKKSLFYAAFGSDFIKSDNGKYFGSIYSNSIGTMLAFPLIKWKINTLNKLIVLRVLSCVYVYLTAGINISGIKAFDSIRTRGIILNKYSVLFQELGIKYVSSAISIKEITEMIVCDKYYTSLAFVKINSEESESAFSKALQLTDWYNDSFFMNLSVEEITEKGRDLHQIFHEELIKKIGVGIIMFERSQYESIIE